MNPFAWLWDTSGFPARWHCGNWTEFLGWLHILSDLGIWSAYVAIPCVLGYFVIRKRDLPFRLISVLFVAFILACGTTHLLEAIIFWFPIYRLAGVLKFFTAVVSWTTVLALVPITPQVLAMRSAKELEREIDAREHAENALQQANTELEKHVERRTAELAEANTTLRNEREWFRTTLASIGDAVIATDVNGLIRFMNPVAEDLAGWSRAEASGLPIGSVLELATETTRQPVENPIERVIRERRIVGLANQTVLIGRDGKETPIEDSAAPIWDEANTLTGAVLVFRDVTKERTAKLLQKEGAERLRLAIESAGMGTWDYHPITGKLTWDARSKAIFSVPTDAEVDYEHTFLDGLHPEDRQPVHEIVQRALDPIDGGEMNVEFRVIGHKDSVERWVVSCGRTYYGESGHAVRFIGTVRDISLEKRAADELRASAEALRAAKEDAEEASEAKSRFLAILSHELRTPLNPILLAVTAMLKTPPSGEEIQLNLEMIRRNVELQARLIDDLLDVMRIVRGKMPLRWEVSNAHALIDRAVQVCRNEISEKSLRLELNLEATHHHINTDSAKLQQVFWNLIKNAVKFTPEGGTISLRTRNEAQGSRVESLIVEVSDNGIGIEPDVLPRIFDPFQQGESSTTRTYGGLGLGLTICKGVVEGHSGTLTARSAGKGSGATFEIRLPALPNPQDLVVTRPSVDPETAISPAKSRLKILVVEDDAATRGLMARLLTKLGHEVATASTIASAMAAFHESEPDLIVSDIGLPDGTGLDLLRTVVSMRKAIPAIALTGYGMDEDIQKTHAAGFTAHMTKPIDFTKLESMILKVSGTRRTFD